MLRDLRDFAEGVAFVGAMVAAVAVVPVLLTGTAFATLLGASAEALRKRAAS